MEANLSRGEFIAASGIGLAASAVAGVAGLAARPAQADEPAADAPVKVKAAYFSPTEGTKNATLMLASLISDDVTSVDITTVDARTDDVEFAADELAIVATPSYGGQIAKIEGLYTNLKGDNTPCVLVCAFGNRAVENCFANLQAILSQQGFVVIGAIGVVTPHVFSAYVGRSRPDADDRAVIAEFAGVIKDKLAGGDLTEISVEGTPEVDFEKALNGPEKIYNAELCTACGECAASCPVGAIDPTTLEVDEAVCISCQRCTHVCQFGGRSYDVSPMMEFMNSGLRTRQPVTYLA